VRKASCNAAGEFACAILSACNALEYYNALRAVLTQNLIVDLLQTLEQRSSCAGDEHWLSLLQPTTLVVFVLLVSMTSQIDTKATSFPMRRVQNSTHKGELQNSASLLLHLLLNVLPAHPSTGRSCLSERGRSRQEQCLHPRMHSHSTRSMLAA